MQESGWTESQRSPNHGPFLAGCRTGPREHPHPCWPPLPVRLLIYPCQPCCSAPGRAHKSAPPALSSPWLFVQAAVYLQPVGPAEPGVRSLFQAPQASLGEGPLGCSPHLAVLRSRPCTLGSRLFRPVLSCPLFSLCGIMASPHLDYPEPYACPSAESCVPLPRVNSLGWSSRRISGSSQASEGPTCPRDPTEGGAAAKPPPLAPASSWRLPWCDHPSLLLI